MNRIWANRLEAGTQTWEDCVKAGRAGTVDIILREDVKAGKITAGRYEEITGKAYA